MLLEMIVVAEARADFEIGFGLAGRINKETGAGHDLRSRGIDATDAFTKWGSVRSSAVARGRRLRHFSLSREPFKGGDAETAWQVVALCSVTRHEGDAPTILLIRDTDNDHERADELKKAVMSFRQKGFTILLAHPDPKREAWVLHGFEPRNAHEIGLLKRQCEHLGFDPSTQSHRLTAKGRRGKLNAKVVLDALTGSDRERENACWEETELVVLKRRGDSTGLSDYLAQIEAWIQPHASE